MVEAWTSDSRNLVTKSKMRTKAAETKIASRNLRRNGNNRVHVVFY